MKADRVVGDTNVLISAAIAPSGKPRQVLEHVRRDGQLLMSREAFSELATRLGRKKFDRYLSAEAVKDSSTTYCPQSNSSRSKARCVSVATQTTIESSNVLFSVPPIAW